MEEEGGRGRGHRRWGRDDEEEMEEERQRWSREGVVGEKGREGSAGLSNVALVYQSDSEVTLVLLKVAGCPPVTDTGISRRSLRTVTEAGGKWGWGVGSAAAHQHTPQSRPLRGAGGSGDTETQTGVCCVHVWWTDDETAVHACRSQRVLACVLLVGGSCLHTRLRITC